MAKARGINIKFIKHFIFSLLLLNSACANASDDNYVTTYNLQTDISTSNTSNKEISGEQSADSIENANSLVDELTELTSRLLLFMDTTSTRYKATNMYSSCDNKYNIYEFGDIKTWQDFETFANSVFIESEYQNKIKALNEHEYSDYYIKNVDNKIGVIAEYDMTIANSAFFEAGNLKIVSESENECVYECYGDRYEGDLVNGRTVSMVIKITAVNDDCDWKIKNYILCDL